MDEKNQLTQRFRLFTGFLVLFGLVACTPKGPLSPNRIWLPSQVRSLDPAESTPNPFPRIKPSQDLIALYTRQTENNLQIRLDLLELQLTSSKGLPLTPNFDLYVTLESTSGESELLIQVPAEGLPTIHSQQIAIPVQTAPRVIFDPEIDAVTISLDRPSLPDLTTDYVIRTYLTNPGSTVIIDEIPAVASTIQVEPVPILLTFWNTLPAHTPAQALRRWDGAHTGPLGERHGLKHLLDASRKNQIPLTLLDLKTPSSLSALDTLGQTDQLVEMQRRGLLILPEVLPESYFGSLPKWVIERTANISRQTSSAFGFRSNQFVYAPFVAEYLPSNYRLGFVQDATTSQNALPLVPIKRWNDQRLIQIPLAAETAVQATEQGLPIELRRGLLNLALELESKFQVAVLGGDLPRSTWGDPQAAQATLYYIAQHPWIQVMNETDLLTQKVCEDCPTIKHNSSATIDHPVIAALQIAPENSITELAWQMFLDLSAPAATFKVEKLAALRANYLGEIGNLLAAAEWEHTQTIPESEIARQNITIDCSQDTDFDNQLECILANENFFALLDPEGGRLSYFFARGSEGVTELLGPSSQFVVGLSDPLDWDFAAGPLADPRNIPGAFAVPWEIHQFTMVENGIRFVSPGTEKTFQLTQTGLRVEIHSDQAQGYQIPVVMAPETRFQIGWVDQYQETEIPHGLILGIEDGLKFEILSSAEIGSHKFQDSQFLLGKPEDANLGYPAGHFIPFPMTILDLPAQNDLWLEFNLGE